MDKTHIKYHITFSDSDNLLNPFKEQQEEVLKWLKKFKCVIYTEYGTEKKKLHYQGLIEGTRLGITNSFKYQFITKIGHKGKLTGMMSFSDKWKTQEHFKNFQKYMTKDGNLVHNSLYTDNELKTLAEEYKIHQKHQNSFKNQQNKSEKFLEILDRHFPEIKTQTKFSNLDKLKLIDIVIDYIFGKCRARNGSESVVRSYYWLGYYHLRKTDAHLELRERTLIFMDMEKLHEPHYNNQDLTHLNLTEFYPLTAPSSPIQHAISEYCPEIIELELGE